MKCLKQIQFTDKVKLKILVVTSIHLQMANALMIGITWNLHTCINLRCCC